jgi:hypothetical protein
MADKKISALTSATTPLAGTEVLPIVQSSATVKVATNDLTVRNVRANATTGILQVTGPTAGTTRVMTTPDANFTVARTDAAQSFTGDQTLSTGNLVIGTSGKGIDFTATPSTGTSELLADYEEGTWTSAVTFGGGATDVTYGGIGGFYTKIGRLVTISGVLSLTNKGSSTGAAVITGLPFTCSNSDGAYSPINVIPNVVTFGGQFLGLVIINSTTIGLYQTSEAGTQTAITNTNFANNSEIRFSGSYITTA